MNAEYVLITATPLKLGIGDLYGLLRFSFKNALKHIKEFPDIGTAIYDQVSALYADGSSFLDLNPDDRQTALECMAPETYKYFIEAGTDPKKGEAAVPPILKTIMLRRVTGQKYRGYLGIEREIGESNPHYEVTTVELAMNPHEAYRYSKNLAHIENNAAAVKK